MFPNPLHTKDISPHWPGLKLVSESLDAPTLKEAYEKGYFPWYNEGEVVQWFSPNPRFVLYPENLRMGKSDKKAWNNCQYSFTFDNAFEKVLTHCQQIVRKNQSGTWLTTLLFSSLIELHKQDIAHSVEVWEGEELVGGLYGLEIKGKKVFCGESMFSLKSNASKMALIWLVKNICPNRFDIIDCQQESDHIKRLGAANIDLAEYVSFLGLAD